MNLVTFNVRGCGNSVKKGRTRQVLNRGKVDMCFMQVSKVEVMIEELVKSIWGMESEVQWSAKSSEGKSGGILIMWKKIILSPVSSFWRKGFLGFNAIFRGMNSYFINVYSPC